MFSSDSGGDLIPDLKRTGQLLRYIIGGVYGQGKIEVIIIIEIRVVPVRERIWRNAPVPPFGSAAFIDDIYMDLQF